MTRKIMQSMMAVVLTLAIFFGYLIPISAQAEEIESVSVIENSEDLCIVKEVSNEGIVYARNDKKKNELTVEKYSRDETILYSSETLSLDALFTGANELLEDKQKRLTVSGNGDVFQHTFSNREYDIYNAPRAGSPNEKIWKIRSGDNYKERFTPSGKQTQLDNFRNAVNKVDGYEKALIGIVGASAAVVGIGILVSQGVAAAAAAMGGGDAVVTAIVNLNVSISDADYWFNEC